MSFALDGCGASMAADRMMPREECAFGASSLGRVQQALARHRPQDRARGLPSLNCNRQALAGHREVVDEGRPRLDERIAFCALERQ